MIGTKGRWRAGPVLGIAAILGTAALAVPAQAGTARPVSRPAAISLPTLKVQGVSEDPATGIAYISADGPGRVLAVSLVTGQIVATIPIQGTPGPIEVDTSGEIVTSAGKTAAAAGGDPVYVGDRQNDVVWKISEDKVTDSFPLPAGATPTALAMDDATNTLWVATAGKAGVVVHAIEMTPGSVPISITTTGSKSVTGMVLDPLTGDLYMAFSGGPKGNSIFLYGTVNFVFGNVGLSSSPEAIALNPVTRTLYVARDGGWVDAFNARTLAHEKTLAVPGVPWSLAVNPLTGTVYYANSARPGQEGISLINPADTAVRGRIPVAGRGWLAVDSDNDTLVSAGQATTGSFISVFRLRAPAIGSASHATFRSGKRGSFTVRTSGLPAASLTEAGKLPPGVRFTARKNGTALIAGTPAAAKGKTYVLTITASNGVGKPATMRFTLKVS